MEVDELIKKTGVSFSSWFDKPVIELHIAFSGLRQSFVYVEITEAEG